MISNGLPLTKIHHAAFDAHLIGVDPDYRIQCLTGCSKSMTARFSNSASRGSADADRMPRRSEDRPDRDRLALRFEQFKKAA